MGRPVFDPCVFGVHSRLHGDEVISRGGGGGRMGPRGPGEDEKQRQLGGRHPGIQRSL